MHLTVSPPRQPPHAPAPHSPTTYLAVSQPWCTAANGVHPNPFSSCPPPSLPPRHPTPPRHLALALAQLHSHSLLRHNDHQKGCVAHRLQGWSSQQAACWLCPCWTSPTASTSCPASGACPMGTMGTSTTCSQLMCLLTQQHGRAQCSRQITSQAQPWMSSCKWLWVSVLLKQKREGGGKRKAAASGNFLSNHRHSCCYAV